MNYGGAQTVAGSVLDARLKVESADKHWVLDELMYVITEANFADARIAIVRGAWTDCPTGSGQEQMFMSTHERAYIARVEAVRQIVFFAAVTIGVGVGPKVSGA